MREVYKNTALMTRTENHQDLLPQYEKLKEEHRHMPTEELKNSILNLEQEIHNSVVTGRDDPTNDGSSRMLLKSLYAWGAKDLTDDDAIYIPKELIHVPEISKRVDKTWLFLTYIAADTPLKRSSIADFLDSKRATKYLISEEIGEKSGTKHHHAIVYFPGRVTLYSLNSLAIACRIPIFDEGAIATKMYEGALIRPNYFEFKKQDLSKVIGYAIKDDTNFIMHDFKDELTTYATQTSGERFSRKTPPEMIQQFIATASTRREAYGLILPKISSAMCFPAIKSVIDASITDAPTISRNFKLEGDFPASDYNYPQEIKDWFDNVIGKNTKLSRWPLMVICGDSGTAKTNALTALGPHMWFREKIAWKELFYGVPDEATYMVFDDIIPEHLDQLRHNKSLLCAMSGGFDLDIKHENAQKVIVEIPSIILTNELPEWLNDKYWKMNSLVIKVHSCMWKDPSDQDCQILKYEVLNTPSVKISVIPNKGYENVVIPKHKSTGIKYYPPLIEGEKHPADIALELSKQERELREREFPGMTDEEIALKKHIKKCRSRAKLLKKK